MTINPVIVVGGGGHASVLLDELSISGHKVLGIVDPHLSVGTKVLYSKVLGNDEYLVQYSSTQIQLVNGIGARPGSKVRQAVVEELEGKGYRFCSVVSSRATVSDTSRIGKGAQILAGAVIQTNVQVGEHVVVNTGANIDHDCILADNVWISPGAVLCGNVTVESGVYVGAGAVVIQSVTLGTGSIISAGSVVTKSVKANSRFHAPRSRFEGGNKESTDV